MPGPKPFSRVALAARRVLPFFILLAPLAMLVPGWDGFVYAPRSAFSDLSISHYPNALFLLDSLRHGQFPFWSPTILGGYPFAANPLAGEWYLPGWLAYLFPLPFGFNLNVLLHLFLSGIGMWFFLRGLGLAELPGLAGALLWELFPKTLAHFGAGHLTLVYAVSWTPWLLLVEQKRGRGWVNLWAGAALGLIALADIRWAAYAGVLWGAYALAGLLSRLKGVFLRSAERKNTPLSIFRGGRGVGGGLGSLGSTLLVAGLIAAPQVLPLLEYSRLSTRSGMGLEDNLALSLSPIYLFGLLIPNFQGYAEVTIYASGAALIGLIWALSHGGLRRKTGFWLALIAVAILLALGSYFPPNQWIARLPGMDLLRVPSRFMLVSGFGLAVVLAQFLNTDLRADPPRAHFWGNLASVGLMGFAWIVVGGLWALSGDPPWGYLWGTAFITASVILVLLAKAGRVAPWGYQALVIGLIVLDVGTASQSNFIYRGVEAVLNERGAAARAIQSQPGLFRVYSPSYSIPQQTAAALGLEMLNGVDPLQLRSLANFMPAASGVPQSGYSVVLPPIDSADPNQANRAYRPDPEKLGWLNVRYVAADYPLEVPGLRAWQVIGPVWIYENEAWRPRAWIQAEPGEVRGPVRGLDLGLWTPNRIELDATGPGFVVLSELNYPGWQVTVDGQAGELSPVYGLLRGVMVGAGAHQLVFSFQPVSVYWGMALGLIGRVWVVIALVRALRGWRRTRERGAG